MLVTDNVSGTCRSRMAVRFITCPVFIIDNYVTRLVLKHRILVFKLDLKLDLIQMHSPLCFCRTAAYDLYELDPK